MYRWTDLRVVSIGCCASYLLAEIGTWFMQMQRCDPDETTCKFLLLKRARILPVFRAVFSNFLFALTGSILSLYFPEISKILILSLATSTLIMSIALPSHFIGGKERNLLRCAFAFCTGYLTGPLCRPSGQRICLSAWFLVAGTTLCHIWCAEYHPSISGYVISAHILTPCIVVELLLALRCFYSQSTCNLQPWLWGTYLWSNFLLTYIFLCTRSCPLYFNFSANLQRAQEREKMINRDSMAIFLSPFICCFLFLRLFIKKANHHVKNRFNALHGYKTFYKVPKILMSSACISLLTMYIYTR